MASLWGGHAPICFPPRPQRPDLPTRSPRPGGRDVAACAAPGLARGEEHEPCRSIADAALAASAAARKGLALARLAGDAGRMCNRYRMTADEAALAARYGFTRPIVEPRTLPATEIFPKKPAYVVRGAGGERILDVQAPTPLVRRAERADRQFGRDLAADRNRRGVRVPHD